MYKLLIADDEKTAREGLKSRLDWGEYGIELTKMAEDAEEAIEIASISNPDLIIADVNMPGMNGLELAAVLIDAYPNSRVIILSGYNDYEYVSKALRTNIFDYLLKPVDKEVLIDTIKKAIKDIELEIARHKDIKRLENILDESLPILKEKCIYYLLNGYINKEQINEFYPQINLNITYENFVTIAVKLVDIEQSDSSYLQLDMIGIKQILYEILESETGEVTDFTAGTIGIILSFDKVNNNIDDRVFSLSNKIYSKIKHIYNREVLIGIGSRYRKSEDVSRSFKEALEAIENYTVSEDVKILFYTDVAIEKEYIEHSQYPIDKENLIISTLKKGDVEDLKKAIQSFFDQLFSIECLEYKSFKRFSTRLMYTVFRKVSEWEIPVDVLTQGDEPIEVRLKKQIEISEIVKNLKGFITYVGMYIEEKRREEKNTVISKACIFMKENFCSTMTINDVARHVHLSAAYFSVLFKKAIGKTAQEYLTSIRMNNARRMIINENMRIYEVGEKVGYIDTRYFIKVYKKHFGVTPGKERQMKDNGK